jgi:hypothetical protein
MTMKQMGRSLDEGMFGLLKVLAGTLTPRLHSRQSLPPVVDAACRQGLAKCRAIKQHPHFSPHAL